MRPRAFTLIELIAVIVVTAILAGVALPAVWGVSGARHAGAARAVVQHLSFARERALNTGNRVWVSFDAGSGSWVVLAEPDGGAGLADAEALADPLTGRPMGMTLGEGEFVGVGIESAGFGGSAVVGFDWLGAPLAEDGTALTSEGSIELSDGTVVRVLALTGDVVMD